MTENSKTQNDKKDLKQLTIIIFLLVVALLVSTKSSAAVTKVGNGDDGRDLEGYEKIKNGKILASRNNAVELLKRLNVGAIAGLGYLIPEVEKTELYIAKKDVKSIETNGQKMEPTNPQGFVFARTFAEPHAPTRFFPVAKWLDKNQLIALHIHEGLHRALPESVRENEDIVSQITLSMTSPNATFDRVSKVTERLIPKAPVAIAYDEGRSVAPRTNGFSQESITNATVRYSYRNFSNPDKSNDTFSSLHQIDTLISPLGSDSHPIGFGFGISFAGKNRNYEMGPLSVSGRGRLISAGGYHIGLWSELLINTLSNDDVKTSRYGRDVLTLGGSIVRETQKFYLENTLGVSLPGKSSTKSGDETVEHIYGTNLQAKLRIGTKIDSFALGAFGEVLISDGYKESFSQTSTSNVTLNRMNIVTAGPEASYTKDNLTFSLFGRTILSKSQNAKLENFGNLLGIGAGEGSVGGSVAWRF